MPVLSLTCPDCGHQSRSLVMAGTKTPDVFECATCGSARVEPKGQAAADAGGQAHPWEPTQAGHRGGCPCCGG